MNCRYIYAIILQLSLVVSALAQDKHRITVVFDPLYEGATLDTEAQEERSLNSTEVSLDLFRCYISNVELLDGHQSILKEEASYHLLDAEVSETLSFPLEIPENVVYDSIRFIIGIDSLTSVSGAMGGDLDPTKGMFWTWNTGYIFFKAEGTSLKCNTRKNRYVYHLGGYDGRYAAQQWVTLPITAEDNNIHINIDLDSFIEQVDLLNTPSLMSPGKEAFEHSVIASSIFKIK